MSTSMQGFKPIITDKGATHLSPEELLVEIDKAGALSNGEPTKEGLVEIARPKDAPLHPDFEWDDAKAGHAHRLEQAGRIMRCIAVVPDDVKDKDAATDPRRVRAMVSVDHRGGRYQPVQEAMADPFSAKKVIERVRSDVRSAIRKAEALEALADELGTLRVIEKQLARKEKATRNDKAV